MGNSLAPIKKWTTRHELIVQMHIGTWPNKKIADHFGISEVRVSQVLNDPKAKAIIKAVNSRIREQMSDGIEDKLLNIAENAVDRVAETVNFEGFPHGSDAKKHQDRVSLDVLKGIGFLPGSREVEAGNGAREQLPVALAERLLLSLEASNEAKEIHEGKVVDGEVEIEEEEEEVDFETVAGD